MKVVIVEDGDAKTLASADGAVGSVLSDRFLVKCQGARWMASAFGSAAQVSPWRWQRGGRRGCGRRRGSGGAVVDRHPANSRRTMATRAIGWRCACMFFSLVNEASIVRRPPCSPNRCPSDRSRPRTFQRTDISIRRDARMHRHPLRRPARHRACSPLWSRTHPAF